MAFLNPFMLLGLTAVAAPIIIHLLNRRQFEKVQWAAMRFLQLSVAQTQRRLKIEDMLLLLLRCLLVALIAIALARPTLRSAQASGLFGQAKTVAVIVLRNSYGMSQTDGINSRFDQAKAAAKQALDALPAGSSAALYLASDVARGVIPEPTADLNFVRKSIESARLCDRSADLMPALTQAAAILDKHPDARREIDLVTDAQVTGFRQLDAMVSLLGGIKEDVTTHIMLVGSPEQQNLGVSDMKQMTEIPAVDQPMRFAVSVTNFGQVDASSVHVTLRVDDLAPCDETTIDTLAHGQSKSVVLFARLHDDQYHTVTAAIPSDRLPADDSRTMAVHALSSVHVLLVDGNLGGAVRDDASFYLRHALVPVSRAAMDQYFIKVQTIGPENLAEQKLDEFDAVALCDVSSVPDAAAASLATYLRHGNSLLIFPGPHTNADSYNAILGDKWGILPGKFGAPVGEAQTENGASAGPSAGLKLQRRDYQHPIVDLWSDPAAGDVSVATFDRIFPLTALPAPAGQPDSGPASTVLRFADAAGTPAIMQRSWGDGNVLQFASSANVAWNDLPVHAGLYVPLMRRSIGWLVQQQDQNLNVTVGQQFIDHPPAASLGQEATITCKASGEKFVRPCELAGQMPVVHFADTDLAGLYTMDLTGKTIEFAVQQKSSQSPFDSESSLVDLGPNDVSKLAAVAHVIQSGQSVSDIMRAERVGAELWMPLAVMALVLATAETFLAHWFSQPK